MLFDYRFQFFMATAHRAPYCDLMLFDYRFQSQGIALIRGVVVI